jgi:UDP-glucose 4-epimerase
VDALIRLFDTPSAFGQVFNVGGDEEVSMNDLARRVVASASSGSAIEHIPYDVAYGQRFDDLPRRVPKLDKIRNAIGFNPKMNLDQIIRSVIDDFRARQ